MAMWWLWWSSWCGVYMLRTRVFALQSVSGRVGVHVRVGLGLGVKDKLRMRLGSHINFGYGYYQNRATVSV